MIMKSGMEEGDICFCRSPFAINSTESRDAAEFVLSSSGLPISAAVLTVC